ncbi:MAG: YfcE family phosphodiesterase [Haloplasmataceae bacterium]|jgi:putative phosphoesterase|nr:YfcE family phosphodiesterase [Haloplasmataceae bacterium]
MVKVVVVSDNHGRVGELEAIYQKYKDETKFFLHCGDSELESNHPIFDIYKSVGGNTDDFSFKEELFLNIENNKILVLHGHYHSVRFDLNTLFNYASNAGADIVCFGHTHVPVVEKFENIIFINPGSIYANRGIRGRTYAIIEMDGNIINVTHYDAQTLDVFKL